MQGVYGSYARPNGGYQGNYQNQAQFGQPQQQAPQPPQAYSGYSAGMYPYPTNNMYNVQGQFPQPYPMSRGRGVGYGRGGFRGRGRGGFGKKRKPFVGGTLETQREWESKTACCFYQQGNCRFGDKCRFLHEDIQDGVRPCQFGDTCRVHGSHPEEENGSQKQEQEGETKE